MPTTCTTFTTEDDARAEVRRLLDAGVPGEGISVIAGRPVLDARDEPVGSFAGMPEDRVGAFAGAAGSRRDAMGSFAGGDARRGGFADVDRDTVATYVGGEEEHRIASHRRVKRLLLDAGLDERAADADVAALHAGRVLVLVREA